MRYKNIEKDNMKNFNNKTRLNNEDGISLLELVIAIGLVLILTVGGLIGYNMIADNSKKAAVENTASQVIRGIAVKENSQNDSSYMAPQDVADEWMASSSGGKENSKIKVTATKEDEIITVKAIYDNNEKFISIKTFSTQKDKHGSENANDSSISEVQKFTLTYAKAIESLLPNTDYKTGDDMTSFVKEEDIIEYAKQNNYSRLNEHIENRAINIILEDLKSMENNNGEIFNYCFTVGLGDPIGLSVEELTQIFKHYGFSFYDGNNKTLVEINKDTIENDMKDPSYGGACHDLIENRISDLDMYFNLYDYYDSPEEIAQDFYDQVNP